MNVTEQEIKALEYINDALDEMGIPRTPSPGELRQTYTTWGRVSVLIERYKSLENHMAHMVAPAPLPVDDGMSVTFAAGSVDYTDKPETAQTDVNGDLPY